MDASPLGQLPVELLISIISHLERTKDRKSLRSTCRVFNSIAFPWVFRDVYVSIEIFLDRQKKGEEGLQQLVDKYGHLVKTLEVDGIDFGGLSRLERCPLEVQVHPSLLRLPNLRSLELSGEPCSISSCSELHMAQFELFKQASLQGPSQIHAFQHLRSLTLDFSDWELGDWAVVFSMHLLEELSLLGLILHRNDPELPSEFRGRTSLKSLVFEHCCINVKALRNILSFPKALVSLAMDHRPNECWGSDVTHDPWTPKAIYEAIAQQSGSLEKIRLIHDDKLKINESHTKAAHAYEETGGDFDLSKFPRLREYDGFYLDSSGKFKPAMYIHF